MAKADADQTVTAPGGVSESQNVADSAAALAATPAGISTTAPGVQAIPAENDPTQDTPDHRSSLTDQVGARVGQDGDRAGLPDQTTLERIPQDQLSSDLVGPHWLQRAPLYPGGPAV